MFIDRIIITSLFSFFFFLFSFLIITQAKKKKVSLHQSNEYQFEDLTNMLHRIKLDIVQDALIVQLVVELLEVFLVVLGVDEPCRARLDPAQNLEVQTTDRRDLALETDLARHREILIDRSLC